MGVAVAMCTHNGMRHLADQLESILAQTVTPDAIYVVDDGSTDGTLEYLDSVRLGAVPLFIEPARSGERDLYTRIAANFAQAITMSAADHDMILLSDQDDVWDPNRVDHQVGRLTETSALMTAGAARLIDGSGQRLEGILSHRFPTGVSDWHAASKREQFQATVRSPAVNGASAAIHRDLVTEVLAIPRYWLHDRWLALRAAAVGRLDHSTEVVIDYRIHPEQAVGGRASGVGFKKAMAPVRSYSKLRSLHAMLSAEGVPELRGEIRWPKLLRSIY